MYECVSVSVSVYVYVRVCVSECVCRTTIAQYRSVIHLFTLFEYQAYPFVSFNPFSILSIFL